MMGIPGFVGIKAEEIGRNEGTNDSCEVVIASVISAVVALVVEAVALVLFLALVVRPPRPPPRAPRPPRVLPLRGLLVSLSFTAVGSSCWREEDRPPPLPRPRCR